MISVVIPLYNKAQHIAETLGSVLAQSMKPREIIVIDDGSTDDGADVVRRFEGAGVRLISQSNQGVSAARNRGLEEATGDYVAFIDADDFWLPDHLRTLSELIEKWSQAVLVSTSHMIKRDGAVYLAKSSLPSGWEGCIDNFFTAFAKDLSLVNASTACVKRRVALGLGGFPVGVKRGEDIILWVRLALHGVVAHKSVTTAVYNQVAENRCTQLLAHEPPGSLVFLSQLLTGGQLRPDVRKGVAALLDHMALVTAASFHLNGDTTGAKMIAKLMREAGRVKMALAIRIVTLMPLGALNVAKKLRHRRVT
jgi:glycosyltransferase involved in cell wall biosynthesis